MYPFHFQFFALFVIRLWEVAYCRVIMHLNECQDEEQTPLQQKLDEFGNLLAKMIGVIAS